MSHGKLITIPHLKWI